MAETRSWHLVLYDIRSDDRLRRVRRVMAGWGRALQYSVYRVRCTARELQRLRYELAREMEYDDRLMIIRLCPSCAGRAIVRGADALPPSDDVPSCHIV